MFRRLTGWKRDEAAWMVLAPLEEPHGNQLAQNRKVADRDDRDLLIWRIDDIERRLLDGLGFDTRTNRWCTGCCCHGDIALEVLRACNGVQSSCRTRKCQAVVRVLTGQLKNSFRVSIWCDTIGIDPIHMDKGSPGKSFAGGRNTPPPGLVPVERKIRWLTATVTSSFDPRELVSWVKEIRWLPTPVPSSV
jgi:hypothetical protein